MSRNKISATELASDIRAGMSYSSLMAKHQIASEDQLETFIDKLINAGYLQKDEVTSKEMVVVEAKPCLPDLRKKGFWGSAIENLTKAEDSLKSKGFGVIGKTSDYFTETSYQLKSAGEKKVKTTMLSIVDAEEQIKSKGKMIWDQTSESAGTLIKKGRTVFIDDVDMLRAECPLLNDWIRAEHPQILTQASILAAAGLGLLADPINLSKMSGAILDNNASVFQKALELCFGKEKIGEISQWMDTIPGALKAGGWQGHRVVHGHDISALVEVTQTHNFAGVAEWFNHVALRDFWSPAGIPYLPFGNDSVLDWLCSMGVSKSTAASILSVNVWDVMGLLLIYRSSRAFHGFIKENIRAKKAKQFWERSIELENLEDFDAANHCYEQVLSYSSDRPEVTVGVAMNFLHRAARYDNSELWRSNMMRAYQLADSARLKLAKDKTIPYYGGIQLSLRGLATSLMVSSSAGFVEEQNFHSIKGVIASAVEDLLKTSNQLKDKWYARPFSAIANEAIALNLLTAAPIQIPTSFTPISIHKRISDTLVSIAKLESKESDYAKDLLGGFRRKYPLGLKKLETPAL